MSEKTQPPNTTQDATVRHHLLEALEDLMEIVKGSSGVADWYGPGDYERDDIAPWEDFPEAVGGAEEAIAMAKGEKT